MEDKMKDELKKCPFCGSDNIGLVGIKLFNPNCRNCGCEIHVIGTKAEAIQAWNTRTEKLLTVDEMANTLCKAIYGRDLDESKPVINLELYGVAKAIHKAQEDKITCNKGE